MKYIASCSFGKDSLATVILAKEHGEPLDEIVYCEVVCLARGSLVLTKEGYKPIEAVEPGDTAGIQTLGYGS